MTAVQHAVQYGRVSKSAISLWRILQKYKLNAAQTLVKGHLYLYVNKQVLITLAFSYTK